jgi:hypothetical protein
LNCMKSLDVLPRKDGAHFPLRHLIEYAAGSGDLSYYYHQLRDAGLDLGPGAWVSGIVAAQSWAGWTWAIGVWGKETLTALAKAELHKLGEQESGLPQDASFAHRWLRWMQVDYRDSDLSPKVKGAMLRQGLIGAQWSDLTQNELSFLLRNQLFSPDHRGEFALSMIALQKSGVTLDKPLIENEQEWEESGLEYVIGELPNTLPNLWKPLIRSWLIVDTAFAFHLSKMRYPEFAPLLREHQLVMMEKEAAAISQEASDHRASTANASIKPNSLQSAVEAKRRT